MAFVLRWLPGAAEEYNRLRAEAGAALNHRTRSRQSRTGAAEGLFKQLHKCVTLLAENPRHPGLRTHEYHGMTHPFKAGQKVFEAYVQNRTPGAYRVFWCYGPEAGEMTILAITPHP